MRFPIHEDDAGQRVDRFLRQWLRRAPISMLQRWIRQGLVRIDGERAEPGAMLEVGREFEIVIDQADLADFVTEPVSQPDRPGRPVVHRHQDQHLWIVDKPAGLA
ncbi:MAG: S4 domain-containing protein, partial [Planctomycetota bacterium]